MHKNCERMLVHMVEGRNEAWHREDVARARVHELEFYVEDLDEYNTNLHEEEEATWESEDYLLEQFPEFLASI